MSDYLRRKLRIQKNLKGLKGKDRGSTKGPSFRFRAISLFLLIFVILNIVLVRNFLINRDIFNLSNDLFVFGSYEDNNFFVSPTSKFSPESPEVILVDSSFVKASSPLTFISPQALGVFVENFDQEEIKTKRTEIIEHIVQEKETLSFLAEKFDISLETIIWANEGLTKNSSLKVGQKLVILPITGIVHYVKSGDTISAIAQRYKSKTAEIIDFNDLSGEADIYTGDLLVIPNGTMPVVIIKKQSVSTPSIPSYSSNALPTPLASSYFIIPVSSPYIITQGLHWHNAIDFSHQGYACGRPVFAAAQGTIQRVIRSNSGYGNYLTILHPNGVVTLYAHLASIMVSPGTAVSQGTIIGYVGNSGYTIGRTGCHLHFEVRGATNPFNR